MQLCYVFCSFWEVALVLTCSYPDMVERLLPFCGSARTSDHNKVWSLPQSPQTNLLLWLDRCFNCLQLLAQLRNYYCHMQLPHDGAVMCNLSMRDLQHCCSHQMVRAILDDSSCDERWLKADLV